MSWKYLLANFLIWTVVHFPLQFFIFYVGWVLVLDLPVPIWKINLWAFAYTPVEILYRSVVKAIRGIVNGE